MVKTVGGERERRERDLGEGVARDDGYDPHPPVWTARDGRKN